MRIEDVRRQRQEEAARPQPAWYSRVRALEGERPQAGDLVRYHDRRAGGTTHLARLVNATRQCARLQPEALMSGRKQAALLVPHADVEGWWPARGPRTPGSMRRWPLWW